MSTGQSEQSYKDLEEAERNEERSSKRPAALPLRSFSVAPSVFQWRNFEMNEAAEQAHMQELIRVLLEGGGAPLDPLLVTVIGKGFFVIDGHHRLDAYHTVSWNRPLPVEYFEGNLCEAQQESLRRNSKNKLHITNRDKLEAAWKLVRQGGSTQKQIAKVTTVSVRTIATMAKVLREHPQANEMTWHRGKLLQWGELKEIDDRDEWIERKAQKWAAQWAKNLPSDFTKYPDVVARALEILDGALPAELIYQWPSTAREVVGQLGPEHSEFDIDAST